MKKFLILLAGISMVSAGCLSGIFSPNVVGIVKTVDGGGSWQVADKIAGTNSDISNFSITEMSFDPTDRQTIFASTYDNGLWVSSDAAQSWKQILSNITVYDFFVDPSNSKNIYVSGIFNGHGKILHTVNGGASWEEVYNEASSNNAVNTITANPANSSELYAALNSGILIKSIDGGINWFVLQNFKNQILRVRFSKLNNAIYVLQSTGGISKSTDGGIHFASASGNLTHTDYFNGDTLLPMENIGFLKLALDDQIPGVMYVTTLQGLYKSTDDGKSWVKLILPVKSSSNIPRAVASTKGGQIAYASIGSTIYKTLDGGQSWQTQALPTNNNVNKILIDPVLPQITYAGLTAQ